MYRATFAIMRVFNPLEIKTCKRKLIFERTENCVYLVLINNKYEVENKIKLRVAKINRCAGSFNSFIKSKRHIVVDKAKTVLKPIIRHATEA